MDYRSCPGSGGLSDASTLLMHPPPGMGFSPPSTPFAYACPAMKTTSSSPQIGAQQGRMTNGEVWKEGSPLPKFVIKGGDATTLTRVINECVQKTTISSMLGRNQQLLSGLRLPEWHVNDAIGGYLSHPIRGQCTYDYQPQVKPYHSNYPYSRPRCEPSC